jgi:hypothetical protein
MMLAAVAPLTGLVLLGCPGTLSNKECFLEEDQARTIFTTSCAFGGCHSKKDSTAGLDLESPQIGKRLKGKAASSCKGTLVDPGNPDNSVLYNKLSDPPPCGSRMPLAKDELYPEDKDAIRKWITGLDGSCEKAGSTSGSGGSGGGTTTSTTSMTTSASGGTGGTGGTGGMAGAGGSSSSSGGT